MLILPVRAWTLHPPPCGNKYYQLRIQCDIINKIMEGLSEDTDMSVNYKQYSYQLFGHLMQLGDQLKPLRSHEQAADCLSRISEYQKRFMDETFRVAVIGEFKRGKSSFVNTLLGQEILPADALPTTAAINRVVYGDKPRARLRLRDGSEQEVPIDQLSEYVTKLSQASADNAARVEEAVVEYPSVFCHDGVELIDTPGLNDDDEMTQVTLSRISQVDLAIVTVSATLMFSETESQLVANLLAANNICQIIFVVTMIDRIPEDKVEKQLQFIRKMIREKVYHQLSEEYEDDDPIFDRYHQVMDDIRLYGVSSVAALKAQMLEDMEMYERSGYTLLKRELPVLLVREKAVGSIRSTFSLIRQIAYQYPALLNGYRQKTERELAALNDMKRTFATTVYEAMTSEEELLRKYFNSSLDDFEKKASGWIAEVEACAQETKGTLYDRQAEIMVIMARCYQAVNNLLAGEFAASFGQNVQWVCGDVLDKAAGKLKEQIAPEEYRRYDVERLLGQLKHSAQAGTWSFAPKPFTLTAYPRLGFVPSPDSAQGDPALTAALVKRMVDEVRACQKSAQEEIRSRLDVCVKENRALCDRILDIWLKKRRDEVQEIVRGLFAAAASHAQEQKKLLDQLQQGEMTAEVEGIDATCRALLAEFEKNFSGENAG